MSWALKHAVETAKPGGRDPVNKGILRDASWLPRGVVIIVEVLGYNDDFFLKNNFNDFNLILS